MSIVVLRCPQCGADIEVDDKSAKTVCYYCQAKFFINQEQLSRTQEGRWNEEGWNTIFQEKNSKAPVLTEEDEEENDHIKTKEEEEMEKVSDTSRIIATIIMGIFAFALFMIIFILGFSSCSYDPVSSETVNIAIHNSLDSSMEFSKNGTEDVVGFVIERQNL